MNLKLIAGICLFALMGNPQWVTADEANPVSVAILKFDERGVAVKDLGQKIPDLLFAKLVAAPQMILVDREELGKTLAEQELNLSGVVKPGDATKIGQLTGAKLIISGTVLQVDKSIHLIARIVGTETSRLAGASVEGKLSDEIGPLVEKLAEKIVEAIVKQESNLVAKPVKVEDRLKVLKEKLGDKKRPSLYVSIRERHLSAPTIDPAAQTELILFARQTDFEVLNPEPAPVASGSTTSVQVETRVAPGVIATRAVQGTETKEEPFRTSADLIIRGEGFSEFAGRRGNLVTIKARVEIQVIDRKTDKVIAVDRQTAIVVDVAEQSASKAALQEASAVLAERILPQLVK